MNGHSCTVCSRRRRRVAELLIDARPWGERIHAVQGRRRYTFVQQEAAVASVASLLGERGVGPGDQVVLFGRNCVEFTVGFWAVGAVAVIANVWWSAAELEDAFAHFEPTLVLCDDEGRERLPRDLPVCSFGEIAVRVANQTTYDTLTIRISASRTRRSSSLPRAARVRPEGVALSQRAVIANLQNLLLVTKRLRRCLATNTTRGLACCQCRCSISQASKCSVRARSPVPGSSTSRVASTPAR